MEKKKLGEQMLLPFELRFDLLHRTLHKFAAEQIIPTEIAVQMVSVLCPICPSRESCTSGLKDATEMEVPAELEAISHFRREMN